jgi:hypothetical protein
LGRSSSWFTKAWILASVIVDRTHATCGSWMEATSAAISPLGFVLDLMLQRVLTCMRKRSTVQSGGASTWLAGVGGWTGARSGARRSQESCGGGKAMEVEVTATRGRRKGNGVNPSSGRLIYRGVHRFLPLRLLPPYNTPQWLYSDKFAR